jgi:hypothetical protein
MDWNPFLDIVHSLIARDNVIGRQSPEEEAGL